uniref:Uncharacterized protein n=1 Tax=viral metagenome TaxID=1070528 RepID=A0A6H2A2I8_9ZZZZ
MKKAIHREEYHISGIYSLCGLDRWTHCWVGVMIGKITCKNCRRIEKSMKKKRAG